MNATPLRAIFRPRIHQRVAASMHPDVRWKRREGADGEIRKAGFAMNVSPELSRLIRRLGYLLTVFWHALAAGTAIVLCTEARSAGVPHVKLVVPICLTLFFVTRWWLGNSSYLRDTYTTAAPWVKAAAESAGGLRAKTVFTRFAFDLILLFLHTAGLTWMADSVGDLIKFGHGIEATLLSDLFWIFYEPATWPRLLHVLCQTICWRLNARSASLLLIWPEDYAPRTWTWTNAIAASVLIFGNYALVHLQDDGTGALTLLTVAGTTDTILDWLKTHCGTGGMRY